MEDKLKQLNLDDEKVKAILKLTQSPYQRYIQTEKGKLAKSRCNAKYKANLRNNLDANIVQDHISFIKSDDRQYFKLTELWKHYDSPIYTKENKFKITRKQYLDQLTKLNLPQVRTYVKNNIKYYNGAYEL
jgi:hypothetical protein